MGSKEEITLNDVLTVPNEVFMTTFNQMFGEPLPKKAPKPKDKEKKGGKDGK